MTAEMGKTVAEARAEIDKCVWVMEHYAQQADEYLAPDSVETDWTASYIQYPPMGTLLAVMPWNYPFWQVCRAAAPALAAGNTVVLKHASNVTGCALALGEAVARSDVPDGLLEVLVAPSAAVPALIADPRIAAVTFTGSDAAGRAVAIECARNLKKSVLELGGSDAFIVLADADLEAAVSVGARPRFQNAGQSCIAAKRFLVAEQIADAFEEAFAAAADALELGDPRQAVDLGPVARVDLRDELADQVRRGRNAGGRILVGGQADDGSPAAFYPPTVVSAVAPDSPLFTEETFGPVAAITRVSDTTEAVRLANLSPFGLSSSIWTEDVELGASLARQIEAGSVFVNAMSASDPRMPMGGAKRSGWGRELGWWGIHEFVNVQAVTVGPKVPAPAARL